MDESVRRYLRLQIELGGSEVVLSRPHGAKADTAASAERATAPTSSPAALTSRPGKNWRQGAPPIPGPGTSIEAPAIDLLSQGPSWSSLAEVAETIRGCTKCFLCEGRTNTVPGEGSARAQMMLVGEGPGQVEDQTGRPFVGRAGELLTEILAAIELPRDQVFICNSCNHK